MAPLVIEGNTLGQKHQNYNTIVKNAIDNKLYKEVPDINYEETDLENLFKIDIAAHNRNVDYILKVLKCDDMLYISRAIKQSTWLITDPQYAHIVNASYLFNELLPQMNAKAFKKLMLQVRLNLKDERRVEEFYNYYKEKDLKTAIKWLPYCSIAFIADVFANHAYNIPHYLLSRLFEKSNLLVRTCLECINRLEYKYEMMDMVMLLFKFNPHECMDIIEEILQKDFNYTFTLNATKLIMTMCCDRVIKNFELFASSIHLPTFAKYIKSEEAKDFVLQYIRNEKLKSIFTLDNVHALINRIPLNKRFEAIKEIFIDKKYELPNVEDAQERDENESQIMFKNPNKFAYHWYIYAPFGTAFDQLKKSIYKEPKFQGRRAMLKIVLSTARRNREDLCTLLKYYREHHINEPFTFTNQFLNHLFSTAEPHILDNTAWGYLSDLFTKIGVFDESNNGKCIQHCIKAILLHKVLQNESVPEIIEKKFIFDTCKEYRNKITGEEGVKLFSYLFQYLTLKIEGTIIDRENFTETVHLLENVLRLLLHWDKELQDFPEIIKKIKIIINFKRNQSLDYDISMLYKVKKSWRKQYFCESILLHPNSQEACINALKHGPEILETYKTEVETICIGDNVHIDQFLKKIRVYWPMSLAEYYKALLLSNVNKKGNQKTIVIGLYVLFSRKELLEFLKEYEPKQEELNWRALDSIEVSLRKHVVSRLYLGRPEPSLTTVLSCAKREYVQYTLHSLNALFSNIRISNVKKHIKQLMDAPVSLQKHSIRFLSKRLDSKELIQLYTDVWNTSKHPTLRFVVFNETFNILCKEKDSETAKIIWKLLSAFIDNLTTKENRGMYDILANVANVPECIQGEFWIKSAKFCKRFPTLDKCNHIIRALCYEIPNMKNLDDDFVIEIFLESVLDDVIKKKYSHDYKYLSSFIWCSTDEDVLLKRYNKLLVPLFERIFDLWDTEHDDEYYVRFNFYKMCQSLCYVYHTFLFKDGNIPVIIIENIIEKIKSNLPMPENYILILRFKLRMIFYDTYKTKEMPLQNLKQCEGYVYNCLQKLNEAAAADIGRACVKSLREDVKNIFPSVNRIYGKVLLEIFNEFQFEQHYILIALKAMLEAKDLVEGHLLVLEIIGKGTKNNKQEQELEKELLDEIQKHPSHIVQSHFWIIWHKQIGSRYKKLN